MLNPKPDPQNILSFCKLSLQLRDTKHVYSSTKGLQASHISTKTDLLWPSVQPTHAIQCLSPTPLKTFLQVQANTGTHPEQRQPSALQRLLHPQYDSGKLPVSDGHRKSGFPPWVCLQRGQWGRAAPSEKERCRLQSCLHYVPASTVESSSENPEASPFLNCNMGSI